MSNPDGSGWVLNYTDTRLPSAMLAKTKDISTAELVRRAVTREIRACPEIAFLFRRALPT